ALVGVVVGRVEGHRAEGGVCSGPIGRALDPGIEFGHTGGAVLVGRVAGDLGMVVGEDAVVSVFAHRVERHGAEGPDEDPGYAVVLDVVLRDQRVITGADPVPSVSAAAATIRADVAALHLPSVREHDAVVAIACDHAVLDQAGGTDRDAVAAVV